MIKFNAGYSKKEQSTIVCFALESGNLNLLKESKPILIHGEDLAIGDLDFVIIYTQGQDQIEKQIGTMLPNLKSANILAFPDNYWVAVVPRAEPLGMLYIVFLGDIAIDKLRDGSDVHFRARIIEGAGTSISVNIFHISDEQKTTIERKWKDRILRN